MKKSQMEITLSNQPVKKQPSKTFEIKISRENSQSEGMIAKSEPPLQRARRERIIPIMLEDGGASSPPPPNPPSTSASGARITSFGIAPVSSTLSRASSNTPEPIK